MVKSIIILLGEVNSGKMSTLRLLAERYLGKPKDVYQNYFAYGGKGICVFPRSPQDSSNNAFCHFEDVVKDVDWRIAQANSHNCALLTTTFTLKGNRESGELLNEHCIEDPIRELSKIYNVHVVYLRKDGSRGESKQLKEIVRLRRISKLMTNLKPYEIESRKGKRSDKLTSCGDLCSRSMLRLKNAG